MSTPETKWTPGPLVYAYGAIYHGTLEGVRNETSVRIAMMDRQEPHTLPTERDANAARLVACWNACLDMQDPAAEIERLRLVEQHAETDQVTAAELAETHAKEIAAMREALQNIIAHHVEQNRIKGRPETESTTLRIARTALSGGVK
jgi:hypothetical protein